MFGAGAEAVDKTGVFNIDEDDRIFSIEKDRQVLDWEVDGTIG